MAFFLTGHVLADLAWYSLVAGAVAAGRRFLSPALYGALIGACGALLVTLGCLFAYAGWAGGISL